MKNPLQRTQSAGRAGIGTTAPLYTLDVTSPANPQIHLDSGGLDSGAYLLSIAPQELALSGGASFNGSDWVAKASTPGIVSVNGGVHFFADTGLTVGNTYTPSSRMTISSAGSVGIGTTTPLYTLDVTSPANAQVHLDSGGLDSGAYLLSIAPQELALSGGASFNGSNWVAKASTPGIVSVNGGINFFTDAGLTVGNTYSPSSRMTISSSGNVGIGTSAPSSTLTVAGIVQSTTGGFEFPNGTVQITATVQGPQGPQGPPGPQGPQGPPGRVPYSMCINNTDSPPTCSCANGVLSNVQISDGATCQTAGTTNSCTAYSTSGDQPFNYYGACCVCK